MSIRSSFRETYGYQTKAGGVKRPVSKVKVMRSNIPPYGDYRIPGDHR